ncbi:unnamed protein product [Sphagnum balticum]
MASTFPPPSSSPPSSLCACFQQPKDQQKRSTSCYALPLRPCWRLLVPIQLKLCVCRVPMCCQKRFQVFCSAASSEDSKKGAGSSEHTSNFALDWDPFEDFFGLGLDMRSRKNMENNKDPSIGYVPEGQYVKEMPCPTCRGRGYLRCDQCNLGNLQEHCPRCSGKGLITCTHCLGECVVREESVNESAWETAHIRSPLNVEDEEDIDHMEIPHTPKRNSKRVYQPTLEVRERISRTLKALEKRTGAISRRVKKQHQDPEMHARMVDAMKRTKRTESSRLNISNKQKLFFMNPENRRMRGLQMKGVPFFCKHCGQEGHRRHYCPDLGYRKKDFVSPHRQYCCSLCKKPGHRRTNCPERGETKGDKRGRYKCGICHQVGHTRRTCPQNAHDNVHNKP